MADDAPHHSRATRWLTIAVLAFVLYVGSATPVGVLKTKGKLPDWTGEPIRIIYLPATWLLGHTLLGQDYLNWARYWDRILPGPSIFTGWDSIF